MKHKITVKTKLDFTLDGSEAIMFSKRGKFSEDLSNKIEFLKGVLGVSDELEISFQIDKDAHGYHEWIQKEAAKVK